MTEPTIPIPPTGGPSAPKRAAKACGRFAATVAVSPMYLSYRLNALLVGRSRALEAHTQLLSLWPGLSGQYLRRAFLRLTLARCHPTATVEFGTFFSQPGSILDENVYVG